MENNVTTRKIDQMTWQDVAFGLAGSTGFVALLYMFL